MEGSGLSVLKTRGISPARKSRSDTGFALLFLRERNHARSALLTVFLTLSPRPVKKEGEKRNVFFPII